MGKAGIQHLSSQDSVGLMMKGGTDMVPLELSVRDIMRLAVNGLTSPIAGPAAHIVSTSIVSLALEPSSLALLIRSGLIDLGDSPSSISTRQRSKHQRLSASLHHGSLLGLTGNPRGLVGDMVGTGKAEHAECAAALLALTLMGERKVGEARGVIPLASQLWPGRVIRAGGWHSLSLCLDILPRSREIQTVVAIAARYPRP